MKYKVGKSNIQGKGLLVTKPIKQGERIGIAHVNNQPTSVVGKYHNHSEEDPTAYSVEEGNKRILFATRDLNPGDEITTNYRMQPELEQPEEFKKGGSTGLPKMPKPSKKGVLAKGYSRSLEATNRVFTQNTLFEKPKSRKRKVFDPKANYALGGIPLAEYGMPMGGGISQNYQGRRKFIHQDGGTLEQEGPTGGITSQEEIDTANKAMMKARLAYAQMHGNSAAQRMVVAPDQPYVYTGEEYDRDWNMPVGTPAGATGTHYMASFGNYAVPFIQQGPNGLYFNELPSIRDREAIRFDNEEDAQYFGGHYKEVTPDKSYRRKIENGSPYITSLSPEDEEQFQRFYNTLPENLQSDDPSYDIRGYWDSEGRPEEFDYSQPKEDDGYYHAYSINQNTGEYLKNPWHPTFQHAIDEDKKIGYRPVVNVKGELIATENPSIADPEEQTFLRNTEGPANYIEAELTPEEIDAYRKGGFIIEEVEEYQGGGQIYTYPDRPGSQYRKVNGKWEIKNKQTGWKFVPVQDPTGERTRNLNQYAVKQTTVEPPKTQQTSGGLDDYYKSALYDKVGQKAESTDTQQYVKTARNIKNAQVEAGKNRYAQDSAIRNAYRNALAADKTISQSYKDKLLKDFATYDLAKQTEVANVYLNKKANPDKVKQAVPQSTLSRAQDYLFNPFDALKASIVYGDISQLPGHYDAARKAGVNMVPRSYQERFNFGDSNIPGRNLVGDVLNYNANFLDAAEKTYYYSRKGDGFQAVSNALRFATPMATSKAGQATWNYLGDVGDAFSATVLQKTPLAAYANKVSSPVLQTALRQASPGNVLSSYSLATGIKNLPATIESGVQYYDRGDTESFKDFANKALATGVALSPVGGQRFLTAVNPYRYAYSAGTSGYNYLKNNSKSVGDDIIDVFNIARNLPKNQFGGSTDFVDTELTDAEIQDMIDSGYIVEELD